jgi:GT2 family glycosyltransferase
MKKSKPKFGVLVLNWNNYEDTKKTLESILSIEDDDRFDKEIYLIDNGSKDNSAERLKKEFSHLVNFYNTMQNKGYTGGNNFGIVKALESRCHYILILNNDLEINNFPLMLDSLNKVFDFNVKVGIVGFDIFDKKTKKILKFGGKINDIFTKLLGIDTKEIDIDENISISFQKSVCGCAICFRSSCIEEIGMFDESFFMYAEEHDISLRAIKYDWKVLKVKSDDLRIYRKVDLDLENQLTWYYNTRNIFCAYKKNLSFYKKNIFYILQFLVFLRQIVYFYIIKKPSISYKILLGLKDAFRFKKCTRDNI